MPKTKNKAKGKKTMTLFLAFLASSPDEASCHACWLERSIWQGTAGGLWPAALEELRPQSNQAFK